MTATSRRLATAAALLLAPGLHAADTYDLRGPVDWEGRTLLSASTFTVEDNVYNVTFGGRSIEMVQNATKQRSRRIEVLAIDGARVTDARVTVETDLSDISLTSDGKPVEQQQDTSPLAGETVRVRWVDGQWTYALEDGAAMSPEQRKAAEDLHPSEDAAAAYPEDPVAVGESWEVSGEQFRKLFRLQESDNVSGKTTLTLENVETIDGNRVATIAANMELLADGMGQENEAMRGTMRLNLQGTIRRDIDRSLDLSSEMAGTMEVEGQLYQQGQPVGSIQSEGPMSIQQSQSFR